MAVIDTPDEAAAEALFNAESGRWMSWCYTMEYSRLGEDTKGAYRDAARQVIDAWLNASGVLVEGRDAA
jgi:hypothetical protein